MNTHQYNQYLINDADKPVYNHKSADNTRTYATIYFGIDAIEYPTSYHSIRATKDNETINECLIVGSGGATSVYEESSLIKNDKILICSCNSVFCINLISLELAWI